MRGFTEHGGLEKGSDDCLQTAGISSYSNMRGYREHGGLEKGRLKWLVQTAGTLLALLWLKCCSNHLVAEMAQIRIPHKNSCALNITHVRPTLIYFMYQTFAALSCVYSVFPMKFVFYFKFLKEKLGVPHTGITTKHKKLLSVDL